MIKTLKISFSLKNTYRVNSILYAIKQIPILKKIIPDAVYRIKAFKVIANILSIIWEVLQTFIGKLLYFLVMIFAVLQVYNVNDSNTPQLFLHLFVLLTIIGGFMNTYMFNPTKDKYYAMILLGMDARKYTLVNYALSIIKVIFGFSLCGFLFGILAGLSVWQCALIPFFVAGIKMSFAAYDLYKYDKKGAVKNENKPLVLQWILLAVLLVLAYAPPVFGFILPTYVSVIFMCSCIILGALSVHKILSFKNYRALYKELLNTNLINQMDNKAQAKIQQERTHKSISTDTKITSKRKGFEYLNELFIKRHQKILWKPVRIITLVLLALILATLILFKFLPESKEMINGALMTYLPYSVFVMYAINRGASFTRALFVNCDHSLLTYSFYKQPKSILKLFTIRLREIVKINLLPAAVLGVGLAYLLYASGGTDNPLNYAVIVVSIVFLSIFFSLHNLTLYYLLQPYNAGTEIKSGAYQIAMSLTYLVSYIMLQIKVQTLIFGIMTIVFCVLYCIIASILVYKLAPKTFKIRN